jgi:hypothetical protein
MRKIKDQINTRAFKHGWCAKGSLAIESLWPSSRASPLQNSDHYIQLSDFSKITMLVQLCYI